MVASVRRALPSSRYCRARVFLQDRERQGQVPFVMTWRADGPGGLELAALADGPAEDDARQRVACPLERLGVADGAERVIQRGERDPGLQALPLGVLVPVDLFQLMSLTSIVSRYPACNDIVVRSGRSASGKSLHRGGLGRDGR